MSQHPHLRAVPLVPAGQDASTPDEALSGRTQQPDPSESLTGHGQRKGAGPPARGRRRWPLILAGVLVAAMLMWWAVSRFSEDPATPHLGPVPTSLGDPGGADPDAARIAVAYETNRLSGDRDGTCALDLDPQGCPAMFGSTPTAMPMADGPTATQTVVIADPEGAVTSAGGTAVLIRFRIEGQQPRQVALLIREGKVAQRVTIGSAQSGQTLTQIIQGG